MRSVGSDIAATSDEPRVPRSLSPATALITSTGAVEMRVINAASIRQTKPKAVVAGYHHAGSRCASGEIGTAGLMVDKLITCPIEHHGD
ncbi:hypothetical protein [Mycobacterium uberis]|uniref:hypothetical protein n=1 Tax=Mycobacterium uberis TaxID=2162698 RepID=UPI001FB4AE80|nr:hypothetical protein [Mycobacterium uberis]